MPSKSKRKSARKKLYATVDANGLRTSTSTTLRDARRWQDPGETIARYVLVRESKTPKA